MGGAENEPHPAIFFDIGDADVAALEAFDANFIPSVRAPMCVGLGNPEMRTLIIFSGEPSRSTAEAVTQ
jgi:hypothetical protein